MNALEKIEDQQGKLDTLAERLYEVHEVLQRILPIVDALVSVVGRDVVLEAAKKLSNEQRDTHIASMLAEFERRQKEGELVESEQVESNSVLFVNEGKVGEQSLRLLPVETLNESFRSKILGAKKGERLDFGLEGDVVISVERIFTPVSSQTTE